MKKNWKKHMLQKHRNFGFTLIEVLVAIAILALLAIPLAQSMITSAQINSQSKNIGSASDMAQTVAESMQATQLGNVLTEINGYDTNNVGYKLFDAATGEGYSFLNNALQGYTVDDRYEVMLLCPSCNARVTAQSLEDEICEHCNAAIAADNIVYKPVTRQNDVGVQSDADVTSSIKTRTTTDNIVRTYFTGNADDTYDFVLKNIHTEEANFDVLVHVEPQQTLQIADISSMSSSNIVNIVEKKNLDKDVAETFFHAHQLYSNLKGVSPTYTVQDFQEKMTRQMTIDIRNDAVRGTTVITAKAIYTAPEGTVETADKYITKTIGSFTTNSTAELAEGAYLYFYPLLGTTSRDEFIINNPDSMAIKIYLIAMNREVTGEYHPSLQFSELTPANAANTTTICSNLPQDDFSEIPAGVTIKTLSNTAEQQTLYSMNVKVYTHSENSFDDDGAFAPQKKLLIVDTEATLLDSSEKFDVNIDTEFGNGDDELPENPGKGDDDIELNPNRGHSEAASKNFVYDGTEHDVTIDNGKFVEWSGETKATDAGVYYAYAKPIDGHTWPNGTVSKRQVTWIISRKPDATAENVNAMYDGTEHTGYVGNFVVATGAVSRTEAGHYTIFVVPEKNHAWEDGSYDTKEIYWTVSPRPVVLTWKTGEGFDIWQYDGNPHSGICEVSNTVAGDEVLPNVRDNRIIEVGKVTANVTSLSNPNYALPTQGTTHELTVWGAKQAEIVMKPANNGVVSMIYNGKEQTGVEFSVGVAITGTTHAIDAGTYTIIATPLPGYAWDAAGNDKAPRPFEWQILQKEVTIQWGQLEWQYDGIVHSTTCDITNLIENTQCEVEIQNNYILDAGTQDVTAVLTNKNYKFPDNPTPAQSPNQTLVVHALKDATYTMSAPVIYDGQTHVWGDGQHVQITGVLQQTEAGTYSVQIAPTKNHTWADGTTTPVTKTWVIKHAELASVQWDNYAYTGDVIIGVTNVHCDWGRGDWKAVDKGTYTIEVTPSVNYAWSKQDDFTYTPQDRSTRTITWKIVGNNAVKPDPNKAILNFGDPILTFEYNGQTWSPLVSTVDGTLPLTDAVFQKNPYYTVTGVTHAIDVGEYTAVIKLKDDTVEWSSGGRDDIVINWSITPREITLQTIPHKGTQTYRDREAFNGNNFTTRVPTAYYKTWDNAPFGSMLKLQLASSARGADGDIWLLKDKTIQYDFDYKPSIKETSPIATGQKITFDFGTSDNLRNPNTPNQQVNKQTTAGVYVYRVVPTIRDASNKDVTSNYKITYDFAHLIIYKAVPSTHIEDYEVKLKQNIAEYGGVDKNLVSVSVAPEGGTLEYLWEHIGYAPSTSFSTAAKLSGKTSKLPGVTSGFSSTSTQSNFTAAKIRTLVGEINESTQEVIRESSPMWTTTIPNATMESKGTAYSAIGTPAGKYVVYYRIRGDENHEDYWDASMFKIVDVAQANQQIIVQNTFDKCHNHVESSVKTLMQENPAISYQWDDYVKTPATSKSTDTGTNKAVHTKALGSQKTTKISSNGKVGNTTITIQAAATENYKAGSAKISVACQSHLHSGVVRDSLNHRCSGDCSVGLHSPGTYSPTCTKDGNYHYDCKECNAYRNERRAALGHSFTSSSGGGPWCISPSWVTITCTRCGYSNTQTIPAAYSAHKYNEWGSYGASDHRRNCYNVVGTKTIYVKDDTGKVIATKSYKIICRYTQSEAHKFSRWYGPFTCCFYDRTCSVCSRRETKGSTSHSKYTSSTYKDGPYLVTVTKCYNCSYSSTSRRYLGGGGTSTR